MLSIWVLIKVTNCHICIACYDLQKLSQGYLISVLVTEYDMQWEGWEFGNPYYNWRKQGKVNHVDMAGARGLLTPKPSSVCLTRNVVHAEGPWKWQSLNFIPKLAFGHCSWLLRRSRGGGESICCCCFIFAFRSLVCETWREISITMNSVTCWECAIKHRTWFRRISIPVFLYHFSFYHFFVGKGSCSLWNPAEPCTTVCLE